MAVTINLPLSPEVVDNRRLLGNGVDLHAKVDAIQTKTDNLPANTSTTLSAISDKVVTVDGIVDAIKLETDKITSGVIADIALLSADVGIVDTVVDAIKLETDKITTDVLVNIATLDTVVDGIQTDLSNGTDGLGALKLLIDSVQATVIAIQNNTRLTASIPQEIVVPATGSVYTKMFVNLYDSVGNKEDSDSNEMAIVLTNTAGTDISSTRLFKDAIGTALDAGTTYTSNGKMVRDSLGRYYFYYKSTSTDSTDTLNFQLKYEEGTVANGSDRAMRVVEQLGSGAATVANQTTILENLATVDGIVDAIKLETDKITSDVIADIALLQADVTIIDGLVDGIKAKTDNLPANTSTTLSAISDKVVTVDGIVDAIKLETDKITSDVIADIALLQADVTIIDGLVDGIKAKTDNLPANTSTTLSAIADQVTAVDAVVDAIKLETAALKNNPTIVSARKTAAAPIAQGASVTLTLSTAEGFNCKNAELKQVILSCTGASTSFSAAIYTESTLAGTPVLSVQGCTASEGLNLALPGILFMNQDTVVTNAIYIKFTNVADASTSSFTASLLGKVCEAVLA